MVRTFGMCLFTLGVVFGAVGCGASEAPAPGGASITGSATFDGKPIENGTVMFTVPDNSGRPVEAAISDGKYSIPSLPPGKRKASVMGFKGDAGTTGEPMFAPSTPGASREVEVKDGAQTIDFAVSTK